MRIHMLSLVPIMLLGCGPSAGTGTGTSVSHCTVDADCADGFCGWDENNDRVCKEYSQVGDSCGGRVIPEARGVCDPELYCYGPYLPVDVPGSCVERCAEDSDCGEGFCGFAPGGTDRICKPFAGEGDECGGRVIPEFVTRCAPELTCIGEYLAVDGRGNCLRTCTNSSDCNNGFCGLDNSGDLVCKPYGQVGDTCGGFVPPEELVICDPAISTCFSPRGAFPDEPGTCRISCASTSDCEATESCVEGVCQ